MNQRRESQEIQNKIKQFQNRTGIEGKLKYLIIGGKVPGPENDLYKKDELLTSARLTIETRGASKTR